MGLKKKSDTIKTKKRKGGKIVCFDEEIVTKGNAKKYLEKEEPITNSLENHTSEAGIKTRDSSEKRGSKTQKKRGQKRKLVVNSAVDLKTLETKNEMDTELSRISKKKRKTRESGTDEGTEVEQSGVTASFESNEVPKKKKKKLKAGKAGEPDIDSNSNESTKTLNVKGKKDTDDDDDEMIPSVNEAEEISVDKPSIKQQESIRAQKRKKHAKLLEEKRLKALLANQQSALNYLSMWKHNRNEWKFVKLRQIWLQQNILDASKIPNEFWNIVIEYFCGAKGSIRNVILKSALDVIEKEEKSEEENTDESYLLILQRARDIVQNLQE